MSKLSCNCILLIVAHLFIIFSDSYAVLQHFQHGYFKQNPYQLYENINVSPSENSDPVSSTSPATRTRHSQVTLSPTVRTQHVFAMLTNDTTFDFDLPTGQRVRDVTMDYKINVVIEKLDWAKYYRSADTKPPCIVIHGVTGKDENKSVKFCYEIHNDLNNFQTVREAVDDLSWVTISAEGDWTDTQAKLVASIYYDVTGGCKNCAGGYFCCSIEGSSCTTNPSNAEDEDLFRCIPVSSHNGNRNSDTICNSHPNCGFICNLDESLEVCSKESNGAVYFSTDHSLDNSVFTIIVFGIFCYFGPLMIF